MIVEARRRQPSRTWLLGLIKGVPSSTPERSPRPGAPAPSISPEVTGCRATRESVRIMVNELPVSKKERFIHSRPPKDKSHMCPVGSCIPGVWLIVWMGPQTSHKYLHTEKRSQCTHFHPSGALFAKTQKWGCRTLTSEMSLPMGFSLGPGIQFSGRMLA